MGDGPETRGALQFEIAAAAIQAERGALNDGAGPDEFLRATAAADGPFLSVESELFALEAAGFGKMRGDRIFEVRSGRVVGIDGELDGVHLVDEAKVVAGRREWNCSGRGHRWCLPGRECFLRDARYCESRPLPGWKNSLNCSKRGFMAAAGIEWIERLQDLVRFAEAFR